jgi:hypothetical protein
MRLDYVSYVTSHDQLADTVQRLGSRLGSAFVDGGIHPRFGTHSYNASFKNGQYIEVVCPLDHPADLTRHILNSLVSREVTTRRVGSKETISIGGLARVISENTNNSIVAKVDASKPYSEYLPRTKGLLSETVGLEESIRRWREWLSSLKNIN